MQRLFSSSINVLKSYPGSRKVIGGLRRLRDFTRRPPTLPKVAPEIYQMIAVRGTRRSMSVPKNFITEIPQAGIFEANLDAFVERDWRTFFAGKMLGQGLEIGALQRPLPKHDKMKVKYVDRFSVAQLREQYPELKDFAFIEPDYVTDAQLLGPIADNSQDFIVATYVFEHLRNPLLALKNWCRVVKPGGYIYFTAPDKRLGFDKKRVRTNIEHIILDYYQPLEERDFDHYLEYAVHVHNASDVGAIAEADRLAQMNYCIHFHVFIPSDVVNLINWFSENVYPVTLVEGPCMNPRDEECHFLLKVSSDRGKDVVPGN